MGRRMILLIAALLVAALGLASCHSPSKPAPPPTTTPPGPTSSTAPPSGIAAAPQAVRLARVADNMSAVGWSKASNLLVYNRRGSDGEWDLYTSKPDGSDERCLTCDLSVPGPGTRGQRGGSGVSPDGKYVLTTIEGRHSGRYGTGFAEPGKGLYNDVWLLRTDGSAAWRLTDYAADGDKGTMWADFDRTGTRIVWAQMTAGASLRAPLGSWKVETARLTWSGGRPRLTDVQAHEPQRHRFYEPYGFTPDGTGVLLSSDYSMPSAFNAQIWRMDVATGRMTRLSPADAPTGFFTNYNEFARYTPDGKWIVFGRTKGDKAGMDYWTMRPDGSDARRLTFTGASWSVQHLGYGNVGGFAFDPDNPDRIFAGRTTDLVSHNIDSYFIDLATGGLRGTYFTGRDFRKAAASTTQNPSVGLAFDPPPARDVPTSGFGVRWTGRLHAPSSGTYTFHGKTDDGSSLTVTVDGHRLGDGSGSVRLDRGTYSVSIEYVNGGSSNGYEQVLWQPPGASSAEPIPTDALSAS